MKKAALLSLAGLFAQHASAAPGFWRDRQFATEMPADLDAANPDACMAACQSSNLPCDACVQTAAVAERHEPKWWGWDACRARCQQEKSDCSVCDPLDPKIGSRYYDFVAWERCMNRHGADHPVWWEQLCNGRSPPFAGAIYDGKKNRLYLGSTGKKPEEIAKEKAEFDSEFDSDFDSKPLSKPGLRRRALSPDVNDEPELPNVGGELTGQLEQAKDHKLLDKANKKLAEEKQGFQKKLDQGKVFVDKLFTEKEKLAKNAADLLGVSKVQEALEEKKSQLLKLIEKLQNSLGSIGKHHQQLQEQQQEQRFGEAAGVPVDGGDDKDKEYEKALEKLGDEKQKLDEIYNNKAQLEKIKSQLGDLGKMKKAYESYKLKLLKGIGEIQKAMGADTLQHIKEHSLWDYVQEKQGPEGPQGQQGQVEVEQAQTAPQIETVPEHEKHAKGVQRRDDKPKDENFDFDWTTKPDGEQAGSASEPEKAAKTAPKEAPKTGTREVPELDQEQAGSASEPETAPETKPKTVGKAPPKKEANTAPTKIAKSASKTAPTKVAEKIPGTAPETPKTAPTKPVPSTAPTTVPDPIEESKQKLGELGEKQKGEVKKTKKEQKTQSKTLTKALRAQASLLKDKHAEAIEELEAAHADELKELQAKHQKDFQALSDEWKAVPDKYKLPQLDKKRREQEIEVVRLKFHQKEQMAELKKTQQEDLDTLKQKQEDVKKLLEGEHTEEVGKLGEKHQEETKKVLDETKDKVGKILKVDEVKDKVQVKIDEVEKVEVLKSTYSDDVVLDEPEGSLDRVVLCGETGTRVQDVNHNVI